VIIVYSLEEYELVNKVVDGSEAKETLILSNLKLIVSYTNKSKNSIKSKTKKISTKLPSKLS